MHQQAKRGRPAAHLGGESGEATGVSPGHTLLPGQFVLQGDEQERGPALLHQVQEGPPLPRGGGPCGYPFLSFERDFRRAGAGHRRLWQQKDLHPLCPPPLLPEALLRGC